MNYLGILKAGLSTIYRLGLTDINYMWLLDGRNRSEWAENPAGFRHIWTEGFTTRLSSGCYSIVSP
jgi:hypothetical protein